MKDTAIRTPRKGTRIGDREFVGDTPVLVVKNHGKEDFVTGEELVEALYEKPVKEIIFKDT